MMNSPAKAERLDGSRRAALSKRNAQGCFMMLPNVEIRNVLGRDLIAVHILGFIAPPPRNSSDALVYRKQTG